MGLRPHSRASGLVLFLFLIFFLLGLVLMLFGVNLGDLDRWLETHAVLLDTVGTWLFRAACGLFLLICGLTIIGGLVDRSNPDRPGIGCMIAAVIAGYFAWFGVTG